MNKIKTGDEVVVLTGRDKGRRGKVISQIGTDLIAVEGVNVVKKHQKPNPAKGVTGGIAEKTLPIHRSNVAIYNAASGRADRVGVQARAGEKKTRVFRSTGVEIKA